MGALNYDDIKLGDLKRRIILKQYTESKDDTGAPLETFSTLDTVFAKPIFESSTEKELINKETGVTKVDFIIRYRSDIDYKNQIEYRSQTYDIIGVEEIKRRLFIKLTGRLIE